ncbi:MAG TPA: hypothetical protein VEI97_07590, partial [bacterium]|nr:hypothetical protein [bacterium]
AGNDGTATCGATAGTRDVWFSYTAPGNCNLTIDTCGSGYDTVLSIHSACPGSGANQLACNDDAPAGSCAGTLQSYITIPVTAGTTYIIRLGGFGGAFGPFTLNVADDCVAFTDCNQNAQNDAAEIAANPALDCFTRTAAPINGFHRMGGPNGTIDACECVANFNRDGAVGTSDISAMLSSWFNDISTGQLKADINCSGSIGTNDVSGFLTIWFNSLNGQPVYQNCP